MVLLSLRCSSFCFTCHQCTGARVVREKEGGGQKFLLGKRASPSQILLEKNRKLLFGTKSFATFGPFPLFELKEREQTLRDPWDFLKKSKVLYTLFQKAILDQKPQQPSLKVE